MKKRNSVQFVGLLMSQPLLLAFLLVGLLVWGLQAPPVYAATVNVDDGGVDFEGCGTSIDPCRTIPYALANSATTGDTVFVWEGTYTETFTLRAGIVISGAGATRTFIDGEGERGPMVSASGSTIDSSTMLRGVTIRRGAAANGGGVSITNDAAPLIEDCIVSENVATTYGGGLYVSGSATLNLRDTQVLSNTAGSRGGGMYKTGGVFNLFECHFENNVAVNHGGGLWIDRTIVMTETAFVNNRAGGNGGGIYQSGPMWRVELTGGRLEDNSALNSNFNGGGLYAQGMVVLSSTQIIGNQAAQWGGGVWANYMQVTDVLFTDNFAGQRGGGLYAVSGVVMTATSMISNTAAQQGGGVAAERDVSVVNSLFARNSALAGAAVWMQGLNAVEPQLQHLTVVTPTAGSAYPNAAAILARGQTTATITNTIISGYPYAIEAFDGGVVYEDYNLYDNPGTDFFNENGGLIHNGSHSLYDLDPRFINPAADNYHIAGESPALDTGAATGITTDLDGEVRPVDDPLDLPDLGMDEFTGLTVVRPVSTTMTFGAARAKVVFDSLPVGLETITITVVPGRFPTDRPADEVISRTIWITPSASVTFAASLALGYAEDELRDNLLETNLTRLHRWNGSTWQGYAGTVDTEDNVVTATGVDAFSSWVIGTATTPTAARMHGARALPGLAGFIGLASMVVGVLALRKRRQWRI